MYEEEVEVIVQINGRVRSKVVVSRGSSKEEVLALALQDEKVKSWLNHGEIKKKHLCTRQINQSGGGMRWIFLVRKD